MSYVTDAFRVAIQTHEVLKEIIEAGLVLEAPTTLHKPRVPGMWRVNLQSALVAKLGNADGEDKCVVDLENSLIPIRTAYPFIVESDDADLMRTFLVYMAHCPALKCFLNHASIPACILYGDHSEFKGEVSGRGRRTLLKAMHCNYSPWLLETHPIRAVDSRVSVTIPVTPAYDLDFSFLDKSDTELALRSATEGAVHNNPCFRKVNASGMPDSYTEFVWIHRPTRTLVFRANGEQYVFEGDTVTSVLEVINVVL